MKVEPIIVPKGKWYVMEFTMLVSALFGKWFLCHLLHILLLLSLKFMIFKKYAETIGHIFFFICFITGSSVPIEKQNGVNYNQSWIFSSLARCLL